MKSAGGNKEHSTGLRKLLTTLLGQLTWTPPAWLQTVNQHRKTNPRSFWGLLTLLLLLTAAGSGGYWYYRALPKPILIAASISAPEITKNEEVLQPDTLSLTFDYDLEGIAPNQPRPEHPPSAARLDLLNTPITRGITLHPDKAGEWRWQSDNHLVFTPKKDWPAGQTYRLQFDKNIFAAGIKHKSLEYSFSTPPFAAELDKIAFYQDPTDKNTRRVVATLLFSHPVDENSLRQNLSLTFGAAAGAPDARPAVVDYTLSFDRHHREAYVQSTPITLPEKENYVYLHLEAGTGTAAGSAKTVNPVTGKVLIPDIFSYLKVEQALAQIVRNQSGEPEQVISLQLTDAIAVSEITRKLALHLLPERPGNRRWQVREVNSAVLEKSTPVKWQLIPNQEDFSKSYNLRMDVPAGRDIYLALERGLRSINDFQLASRFDSVINAPQYPRELKIMAEGSLLSLRGQRTLSFMSRGLSAIKVRLGKLPAAQINHLISQTSGDINNPRFDSYNFGRDNLASTEEVVLPLAQTHPKTANFASLDLSPYMTDDQSDEPGRGLFLIEAVGWDPNRKVATTDSEERRLILITDFGVIVKHHSDGTQDVFVQSVSTGKPVANASVALLGKNGRPVFTATTNGQGHVQFAPAPQVYNEKQPTVYTVQAGRDFAFIPYNRYTRQIDYSRFDVGGTFDYSAQHSAQAPFGELNAYLFSDRGIYRPGETVHIGAIVKQKNMNLAAGVPLDIEVRNPRGSRVLKSRVSLPEKGFFDTAVATEASSETGTYQAFVYLVDDSSRRREQLGSVSFRVEEFQPDTLKITTAITPANSHGWVSARALQGRVTLANLFGAPAQERKVEASLQLRPAAFHFDRYADFVFVDPLYNRELSPQTIEEMLPTQQTDADGQALFDLAVGQYEQGTYALTFRAEGFEAGGGRSVRAESRVLISPLATLVGYKADGDLEYLHREQKRTLQLIAIDNTLEPQALADLTLQQVELKPVSTLVRQRDGTYGYQTVIKEQLVAETPFAIAAPGSSTTYALPTTEPGRFQVRLRDARNHLLTRVEYQVVGAGNLEGRLEKNAELSLKLSRGDYKAGDTIEMNITAPYTGSGLITLESDSVHAFKWFTAATSSSLQTIDIPADLEGNAYVNVTFVRAPDAKEIFTSPLSYAVQPFSIDRGRRTLGIELQVPDKARPGQPLRIDYRTDQPAKIAVFAVDEGILQVAGYTTPDPLNHFLRKRGLAVTTYQILDLVLPEYRLLRAAAGIGGGSRSKLLGANLNPFARSVDKPAVFWSGILEANGQSQTLTFDIPDTFSGSLRVMAVAAGDTAMGAASRQTLVRGPFVLSPNVLTVAAPGDEFVVTVGVANGIEGSGENAEVAIAASTTPNLQVLGQSSTQVVIAEGGEGKASFRLKAGAALGEAAVTFSAVYQQPGAGKREESQRTATLSLRPPQTYSTEFYSGFAASGRATLALERELYPQLAQQRASASAAPLVLVNGLTTYLEHFPHGCTEQVVSQVFPWIGLVAHPAFADQAGEARRKFQVLIDRLRTRQQPDGGFALWPGNHHVAEYPSVYVMHFLTEARQLGYGVPAELYGRGLDYLREISRRGAPDGGDTLYYSRVRANAIYLLTRNGEVTTNYLVDLQQSLSRRADNLWEKDIVAVYMAATYQLLHKQEAAEALIERYRMGAETPLETSDYHSGLTQDAQYLYLLSKHFPARFKAIAGEDVLKLVQPIFRGEYNTIASAYAVMALSVYSRQATLAQGGDQVTFASVDAAGRSQALPLSNGQPFPTVEFAPAVRELQLQAGGGVYYLATQAGFDRQLPATAVSRNLEISRAYLDKAGNEVSEIAQGAELTVRLRVRALEGPAITNVAVIDLLPGGFEVIRSSVPRQVQGWAADYVDVREDRVVFYGSFGSRVTELYYRVKATAAGEFTVPAAAAEAMYDRAVRARSAGGKFLVTAD